MAPGRLEPGRKLYPLQPCPIPGRLLSTRGSPSHPCLGRPETPFCFGFLRVASPTPCSRKGYMEARHWWLTPIILATWEAKIGRSRLRVAWENSPRVLQNNQSKMNWRHGLSGTVSILQVQSPVPSVPLKKKNGTWRQKAAAHI
jgi:hypothetical protein